MMMSPSRFLLISVHTTLTCSPNSSIWIGFRGRTFPNPIIVHTVLVHIWNKLFVILVTHLSEGWCHFDGSY
ncbi:hypothetical protein DFH94DRAFT_769548 [Russula ochroleuca]|uniref:Uncharacterized protein n=1 Tax=Russula ochroleuca TaxID=152965 RepID=A0A9P5JYZ2_9AGAM|nr:hypothetical protein DFH94DRAFT_769548 [Russula ochroleuca]